MTLQQATETDLARVVSWIDSERNCRLWAGPWVSYPIVLHVLQREIEFQPTNSFVARIENDITGFGQILARPGSVNHLARIIVNPVYRGMGYGTGLLEALISTASQGSETITLNVYRANNIAVAVYNKLGFVEDVSRSTDENLFMVKA